MLRPQSVTPRRAERAAAGAKLPALPPRCRSRAGKGGGGDGHAGLLLARAGAGTNLTPTSSSGDGTTSAGSSAPRTPAKKLPVMLGIALVLGWWGGMH